MFAHIFREIWKSEKKRNERGMRSLSNSLPMSPFGCFLFIDGGSDVGQDMTYKYMFKFDGDYIYTHTLNACRYPLRNEKNR